MNIFFQFILLIFLILVLLVPSMAPIIFNFLSILFTRYLIPHEISTSSFSSILFLSLLLSISSLFANLFLFYMGFNHKTILSMLAKCNPTALILKFMAEFVAILIGYTFLKHYNFTSITFYRTGLLLFAFTSSCLNLIFTFCKGIILNNNDLN